MAPSHLNASSFSTSLSSSAIPPQRTSPKMSTRNAAEQSDVIYFSATSKSPWHLLSNFYGDVELSFMAARFEDDALRAMLEQRFATCSLADFREIFRVLHPSGRPGTYTRASLRAPGGVLIARGILARLCGTAAVKSSPTARRRMAQLNNLAGRARDMEIVTNTRRVLEDAGLGVDCAKDLKERAIENFNDALMKNLLRIKFRRGHYSEDGVEFRALLKQTRGNRLRERGFGAGSRWTGRGDDDGVLGTMLMELRDEILREDSEGSAESDSE